MDQSLASVSDAEIDEGVFKYILIELTSGSNKKYIVRGYKDAPFHADIFEKVEADLAPKGYKLSCKGGGRINHDKNAKSILVYGYSQGYGKADHLKTVEILKKVFKYPNITWTDEGY